MNHVILNAVGDVCLHSKSGLSPFENVKDYITQGDIAFANLETVLFDKGQHIQRAVPLSTHPDKLQFAIDAGFNVFNIANNHILDKGESGFRSTIKTIKNHGAHFIGARNYNHGDSSVIIRMKNINIGFLGYNGIKIPGFNNNKYLNNLNKKKIIEDIRSLKSRVDVVVVSLHWGIENVFYPSPEQITNARLFIDEGCDIIIGHHPSVLQGIEEYHKGLIIYSLGNFQFIDDAHRSIVNWTKISTIISIEISKYGYKSYKLKPVIIDDNYAPYTLSEKKEKKIFHFIKLISNPISKNKVTAKWWFEQIAKNHLVGNIDSWKIRINNYGLSNIIYMVRWFFYRFQINCIFGLIRKYFKNSSCENNIEDLV